MQSPSRLPRGALPREAIAAGTPAAPAWLPPPAGSQGSDQQPGFNPLNTGCIDPEPCSAPPCLASPPTLSHLICTALISRPANFSIRLLLTQGAQEMQFPTSPRPPAHCRWLSTNGVLWGPRALLGTSHPSGASLHLPAGCPWCVARCMHTECPPCPSGTGEPPVPPFTHSPATTRPERTPRVSTGAGGSGTPLLGSPPSCSSLPAGHQPPLTLRR